jgi:hypothetical protein
LINFHLTVAKMFDDAEIPAIFLPPPLWKKSAPVILGGEVYCKWSCSLLSSHDIWQIWPRSRCKQTILGAAVLNLGAKGHSAYCWQDAVLLSRVTWNFLGGISKSKSHQVPYT